MKGFYDLVAMAFSADSYEKRCNILCNKGVTFDVTHDF